MSKKVTKAIGLALTVVLSGVVLYVFLVNKDFYNFIMNNSDIVGVFLFIGVIVLSVKVGKRKDDFYFCRRCYNFNISCSFRSYHSDYYSSNYGYLF